jgi:dTDP-glucose pyrophosphorylase
MTAEKHFSPFWRKTIIPRQGTIRDALTAITASGALMACILGENDVLQAILTDSDIRRALLHEAQLDEPAWPWANQSPVVALSDVPSHELNALAETNGIREFPIIDDEGRLVDIFVLAVNRERVESVEFPDKVHIGCIEMPNPMLIQAGGLGTRLRSVVGDRPKPLAMVGDRPILETLIFQAAENGFRRIFVSVNYMADLIEEHLDSAKYRGLEIVTVRETQRLGTAGSIGLIVDEIDESLLVCNADVLTTVPFRSIVHQHVKEGHDVTISVRPHAITIPYGVVEIQNGLVSRITEKPEKSYLVNAGIYVLKPHVCRKVERNKRIDMPDLIAGAMLDPTCKVSPFLLHEYWIDIGHPEDFHRANNEFEHFFGKQ